MIYFSPSSSVSKCLADRWCWKFIKLEHHPFINFDQELIRSVAIMKLWQVEQHLTIFGGWGKAVIGNSMWDWIWDQFVTCTSVELGNVNWHQPDSNSRILTLTWQKAPRPKEQRDTTRFLFYYRVSITRVDCNSTDSRVDQLCFQPPCIHAGKKLTVLIFSQIDIRDHWPQFISHWLDMACKSGQES